MTTTIRLRAKDMMATRLITFRPDQYIHEAVQTLLENKISGAPVVDENNHIIGMLSEKDCIQALMRAVHHHLPPAHISDVMTPESKLITVNEDDHMLSLADLFLTKPIRRLPVVRDGILVGQISRRDLLAAAAEFFIGSESREKAILYLSALEAKAPV